MEPSTRNSRSTLSAELKSTFKLGYPIMGAQLLMLSMVFIDNIMVGPLGPDALAALALATGMYSLANIVIIGVLGAMSPMITHPLGKGDHLAVGRIMRHGWIFACVLTCLLVLVLWNSEPLLHLFGQKSELIPDAADYLRIMCFTAPAQMLVFGSRHLTEAVGDSMIGALIVAAAALLNIPLDYALIHGFQFGSLSIPAMGVTGAAIATAVLSWLSLIAIVVFIARSKKYSAFKIWHQPWAFEWHTIREMVRIGVPLGGAIGAEMAFFVATTLVMGTITTDALAAHQVALNAASMTFMVPLGLSFAVSIRVGHFSALGDQNGVRNAWKAGVIITLVTQTLAALAFFLLPETIVALYSQTDQVANLAVSLLAVAAFFQLVDGLQVVGMGALRGAKDTAYAFKATMIAFWVLGAGSVASAYFLFEKSPRGIWVGLLVGLSAASAFHHLRMHSKTKSAS